MPKKTKKEIMKENEERIAQLKLLVGEKKKKEQSKGVSSNLKEEILKKKRLKKLKQDKFDEEVERIRAGIRVFRGEREKERLEKLKDKYPFLRKKTDKKYIEFRDNFVKQYPTEKEVLKGVGRIYFDEVLKDKSIERLTYYRQAGDIVGGFDYEKKKFIPPLTVEDRGVDDLVAKSAMNRLLKRWKNAYGVYHGFSGKTAIEYPHFLLMKYFANDAITKVVLEDWNKLSEEQKKEIPIPKQAKIIMKIAEKDNRPILEFKEIIEKEKRRKILEDRFNSGKEMPFEELSELFKLEEKYKNQYLRYMKMKDKGNLYEKQRPFQDRLAQQGSEFDRIDEWERRFQSEIFRDELKFDMRTDYIRYFQRFNDITEEEFDKYLDNIQQSMNRITPESMKPKDGDKVELYSLADYIIENPMERSKNYKNFSFIRGYEEDLKKAYEDVKNETFNEENLGQILTEGEEELSRDDLTKVIAQQLETYTYWNNEELIKKQKHPALNEPYKTKLKKYNAKIQKYLGSNVYNKSFMDRYS